VSKTNDHVAILLTPRAGVGGSAIAVVRVCGVGVPGFLARFFSGKSVAGRCVYGSLRDGQAIIDDVVVVAGRDWADICLHGGAWVVESALNLAQREGFEVLDHGLPLPDVAVDGLDELEREMMAWLPLARTPDAVRMLLDQRRAWREAKEKGFDAAAVLADRTLWRLLHPPEIAIVGEPNVGKSTLANRLFGQQRSITADVPGTTRDWVGEMADIGGMPSVLIDTPGLRETEDAIERAAIEASEERILGVELVVRVLDATNLKSPANSEGELVVMNKIDLAHANYPAAGAIGISAKTGEGIDQLCGEILRRMGIEKVAEKRMRWWTERQREVIKSEIRNPNDESNPKPE
jgi:small GTP-binding protein